ncbi:MAG TPA: methionine synthase [Peptococcaceae bacterium]|nr:methionine synthase [Peptococcaceae bacterium]
MSSDLVKALSELQEEKALDIVRKLIDAGDDPLKIMDACGKAMEIVGKKYEDGVYFVPDLIYAGEILKGISAEVKPHLGEGVDQKRLGQVILGTVAGDIHDIGKDVVNLMLDSNGFEVHDLGIDVPVEEFIEKIKETGATVVAMSGLLTMAFDSMKQTVDAIKEAGMRDQVKIMIGGSQVDEEVRVYTGADTYGNDAMSAVNYAKQWLGGE